VKRLAASFEVAGRDQGFTPADRRMIVTAAVGAYPEQMRRAAAIAIASYLGKSDTFDRAICGLVRGPERTRL